MSVITEENLLVTVVSHDQQLAAIKERHDREDEEDAHRDTWRKDTMLWIQGIGILVGGELLVKLVLWGVQFIHVGSAP